jgi:hypothetical protein
MFNYHQNLGFNNPYYFLKDDKLIIHSKLEDVLANFDGARKIDSVAVVEVLNKNYPLADRTVLQNISKTPWLAQPNHDYSDWEFAPMPLHGKFKDDPVKIARHFFDLICEEIATYLKDKKTVGLLLSGGMDSRMVAGALDYLIKTNKLDVKVTALTWGNNNTRDVIYAERIAKILGWEWKHYIVEAKDLLNNIAVTGRRGCEYSPIHLHAIPQIRETVDVDVILAGSYGDSIGRAEYGGVHVSKLPKLNENLLNVGNLINKEIFQSSLPIIQQDIDSYHDLFTAKEIYMQNEYDYQLHYMRRQLNPCMELLNENSNFFQVFTSPNTFRYIWNIDPGFRNDELYKIMLTYFKTDLSEIPWARTGLKYGSTEGNPDNFLKRHHSYVDIMNFKILDDMKEFALTDAIKNTGIFNYASIEQLFKLSTKYPLNSFYYTEKLAWIASLGILVDEYKVSVGNATTESEHAMKKLTSTEYMPKYYRNILGGYLRKFNLIK